MRSHCVQATGVTPRYQSSTYLCMWGAIHVSLQVLLSLRGGGGPFFQPTQGRVQGPSSTEPASGGEGETMFFQWVVALNS